MLLYIVQDEFWIELLIQRRLCPIFVKLWIPVNGTQRCGIELHDIHRHFAVNEPADFGASQLGIRAKVCDYVGLDGHGSRPFHSLCISCFVP